MYEQRLKTLAEQHRLRRLRVVDPHAGPIVLLGGKPVLSMASNDYLAMAGDQQVKAAAAAAVDRFGVGSGASRLISGTCSAHAALEGALATFKGTEAAVTLSSGYATNLGVIPALIGSGGEIFADRLAHASLIEGSRLSGATLRVFRHNDVEQLRGLLADRPAGRPTLIVTEGIFSMDGDAAPLPAIVDLAERYDATVFLDDAHGTGVMGATGRGCVEHWSLHHRIPFHMGTLSKALGTSGGFMVGPSSFIEYLINTAKAFIYSTAPPPAVAAAAVAALHLLTTDRDRLSRLWRNRAYWFDGLTRLGFTTTATVSPIVPIIIGSEDKALSFAEQLLDLDVYAPAIRPPTVPKETSRIRTTVTAAHEPHHLDRALAAFQKAGQALRLI